MIDHLSLAVRDLSASDRFFSVVLETLGYRRLVARAETVGFGKSYPEIWLNARPDMAAVPAGAGWHVCLRAPDEAAVRAFHAAALAAGGADEGAPGPRTGAQTSYYAAFVRDPDGNRLEAASFPRPL